MTTQELADEAAREAQTLAEQWEAGDLSGEQFAALAAAVVLRANVAATTLADVALARELSGLVGEPVGPLGLVVDRSEPERLRQAFATLTEADDPIGARVVRVADNEPRAAAAKARGRGIARSPRTSGWTRTLNGAKSCPFCQRLTGKVLPKSAVMFRHTGCDCIQTPTTK